MKNTKFFFKSILFLLAATGFITFSASAQKPEKFTDPQIAAIAVTANQIDVDYAKIAEKKSKNEDVLNFAKMMVNDHSSIIDQAKVLVKRLKITPEDNGTTKSLKAAEEKTKKLLESKSEREFDKTYIKNEIAYHKEVIKEVDDALIPDAHDPALKSLLQNIMPVLKGHLQHAEDIQKKLEK